jgi:putative addiction module killer protein
MAFTLLATEYYDAWLNERTKKDRPTSIRIRARVDRMIDGNFGDSKSVGDGVSELRLDFGPGYRVYYTQRGLDVIVLLIGGDKSSQDDDIKTAKGLAKDLE